MRSNLHKYFHPDSIAIVGASNNMDSVGYKVFRNIIEAGYKGKLFPINLKYSKIQGEKNYLRLEKVRASIDLVIIVSPLHTLSNIIDQCGKKKVPAVLIISTGPYIAHQDVVEIKKEVQQKVDKYGLRILGPNRLGLVNTSISLNASISDQMALKGSVAFISQSGALCSSILDWSRNQKVGFSHIVSIGSTIDVDFHDLINYFGTDRHTNCIVIYMESLRDARSFISAARAFARSKPIIILKAGRSLGTIDTIQSDVDRTVGNDDAFDAAFKRAGIIRVNTIAELFHCAQALSMHAHPKGNRLAIITNAKAPGILATDYLLKNGGHHASFSKKLFNTLSEILPSTWGHKDAVDLTGHDSPRQYAVALDSCLSEPDVNAVLVILTPQSEDHGIAISEEVSLVIKRHSKPVFASWMGEKMAYAGRSILEENRIPNYRYPERAVDTFLRIHSYFKNLELLYEFTPTIPEGFTPEYKAARTQISQAQNLGQVDLTALQSRQILSFYDIPINEGVLVTTSAEAIAAANDMGYPVTLKALSSSLRSQSKQHAIRLGLHNAQTVADTFNHMLKQHHSDEGVLVERMAFKDTEMLVRAKYDSLFGPVLVFGTGGRAADYSVDYSIALLPINMNLAKRLVAQTQLGKALSNNLSTDSIDMDALHFILYKLAYLVMDFPEIKTIDINPLAADKDGCIALDAMITIYDKHITPHSKNRLAILPYPSHYEKTVGLKDGTEVCLRPIRPEDEPLEADLFERLSKETIYFRFFGYAPDVDHSALSRFTHIDYDREMAIVAEIREGQKPKLIGVVRMISDAWKERAEYAIVLADTWHGKGLGSILTDYIIDIAKEKGISVLEADVLAGNQAMIRLFKRRGFQFTQTDATEWHVELDL
ncbi:MAG: GNAT family N-acetyltransferase [Saprospiraceae bacterium]|nr:GNAT family N-acetyltransferase [Saprospiraceae bacterium]